MMSQAIFGSSGKQTMLYTLSLSLVILTSLMISTSLAAAQNPDFTVTASPNTLCVNPGITGRTVISFSSVGGFSGNVNTGDSISPSVTDGPSLSSIPSTVSLSPGQTVSFNLDSSTSQSTPARTYLVTVVGISGATYRQAQYYLVVSTDCSVGGTVVPTGGQSSMGFSFALGIAVVGAVGVFAAGLIFYVSRRSRAALFI